MITGTTGATGAYGYTSEARKPGELDKEAFLRLLITELSNQDPLRPMDDKEFIAQLAQFSSLEQMQAVNNTIAPIMSMVQPFLQNQLGLAAASWIGKTIVASDPNPPTDAAGVPQERTLTAQVESVRFTEDGPVLRITATELQEYTTTGELVEVEVDKDIPFAYVHSVS